VQRVSPAWRKSFGQGPDVLCILCFTDQQSKVHVTLCSSSTGGSCASSAGMAVGAKVRSAHVVFGSVVSRGITPIGQPNNRNQKPTLEQNPSHPGLVTSLLTLSRNETRSLSGAPPRGLSRPSESIRRSVPPHPIRHGDRHRKRSAAVTVSICSLEPTNTEPPT
jgi:hypothetical protein